MVASLTNFGGIVNEWGISSMFPMYCTLSLLLDARHEQEQ